MVGNNFLLAAAQFVCVIIELPPEVSRHALSVNTEITKVVAAVNRTLAPPLRIAWSRILILNEDQHIPYTRKRTIFRKKLQTLFGDQLSIILTPRAQTGKSTVTPSVQASTPAVSSPSLSKDAVENIVFDAVSAALGLSPKVLAENSQSTFAEVNIYAITSIASSMLNTVIQLGMDSAMATIIVNNLNHRLLLDLALNTCHTHIDLAALTAFVCQKLGLVRVVFPTLCVPEVRKNGHQEPVVIVGQALRLPGDIHTPESFWQALIDKRQDIMTPTPPDRWDHGSFRDHLSGQITFEKSGFIKFDSFDNTFFGISAPEALYVSPTVRLVLEVSFEALENANIPISKVRETDMGVFVAGGLDTGYSELLYHDKGYDGKPLLFRAFYPD